MRSQLAMHSLATGIRPRLSETEPKWFLFETSCYFYAVYLLGFNLSSFNFFKYLNLMYKSILLVCCNKLYCSYTIIIHANVNVCLL